MQAVESFLLEFMQVGVLLLDAERRLKFWNRWFRSHLANVPEFAYGEYVEDIFPEICNSRLYAAIDQAEKFNLSSMLTPGLNKPVLPLFQKPADRKINRRMQQLIHVIALRHEHYKCMLQIQDVTATIKREQRLKVQSSQLLDAANRDALTGVGNRRRFDSALQELVYQSRQKNTPLSLLIIDVDHFKSYNDFYGHPKGDECLKQIAQALQLGLRQDSIDSLCRYGGEEFAILLPDVDRETAFNVAERLRIQIEGSRLENRALAKSPYITVSIGVSTLHPDSPQPVQALVTTADLALYQAKEAGRNCCMSYDMQSAKTSYVPEHG